MSCTVFLLLWAASAVLVLLGFSVWVHKDPQDEEEIGWALTPKEGPHDVGVLFLDACNRGDSRHDHGDDVYGYGFRRGEYR